MKNKDMITAHAEDEIRRGHPPPGRPPPPRAPPEGTFLKNYFFFLVAFFLVAFFFAAFFFAGIIYPPPFGYRRYMRRYLETSCGTSLSSDICEYFSLILPLTSPKNSSASLIAWLASYFEITLLDSSMKF